MDILHIDVRVLLVQIGGFALLLLVFKRFLFGPVSHILESRKQEIASDYENAERDRSLAEDLRQDYDRRLAGIEVEARERIQAAIKEGQEHRDALLAEAREEAERLVRRGEEELEREHAKAMVELREEVVDLAISSARKLIERSLDDPTHRAMIKDFIDSIEVQN